ncbi:MAG: YmdB family metallophosphoesterase, partial [Aureliella sp.]
MSSQPLPTELPDAIPRKADSLRVVLIGDIVGKPGMRVTCKAVAWLREQLRVDAIVANAENAADGVG